MNERLLFEQQAARVREDDTRVREERLLRILEQRDEVKPKVQREVQFISAAEIAKATSAAQHNGIARDGKAWWSSARTLMRRTSSHAVL